MIGNATRRSFRHRLLGHPVRSISVLAASAAPSAANRALANRRGTVSLALEREGLALARATPFCLEVLAALAGADNRPARAARLLGAADGLRERFGLARGPVERVEYLRIEAAAMGGAALEWFAAARAEGHAMSLADAVAYALAPAEPAAVPSSSRQPLSQRERQVVELLAQGRSNREIAQVLVVSERTIEAHVTHVLQKLGLRSRVQVAIWAVERGLDVSNQVAV